MSSASNMLSELIASLGFDPADGVAEEPFMVSALKSSGKYLDQVAEWSEKPENEFYLGVPTRTTDFKNFYATGRTTMDVNEEGDEGPIESAEELVKAMAGPDNAPKEELSRYSATMLAFKHHKEAQVQKDQTSESTSSVQGSTSVGNTVSASLQAMSDADFEEYLMIAAGSNGRTRDDCRSLVEECKSRFNNWKSKAGNEGLATQEYERSYLAELCLLKVRGTIDGAAEHTKREFGSPPKPTESKTGYKAAWTAYRHFLEDMTKASSSET